METLLKKHPKLPSEVVKTLKEQDVKIKRLEQKNELLKDENDDLQSAVDQLEGGSFKLEGHHANLTTQSAIEQLFNNLDRVPIQDLQNFLNQYPTL